jgi:predicted DNA binding CopG/RHH family protein
MRKAKLRDMPVVTIHLYPSDKEALKKLADAKGMMLATYCRMILLENMKR